MSDPRSVSHKALTERRIAELRNRVRFVTACAVAVGIAGIALRLGIVAAQIELPAAADAGLDVALGVSVVLISVRHARRALRRLELQLHDAAEIVAYMGLVQAMLRSIEDRLLAAIVTVDGCGRASSAGAFGYPAVPTGPQATAEPRCRSVEGIKAAVHELRGPNSIRHRIDEASVRLLNRFSRITSPPLQFCPAQRLDRFHSVLIITATAAGAAGAELALFSLADRIEIVHKLPDAIERMHRRSIDLVVIELEFLSVVGSESIAEFLARQMQTTVLVIGEVSTNHWPSVDLSVADTIVAGPATPMDLQIAAWELLVDRREAATSFTSATSARGMAAPTRILARAPERYPGDRPSWPKRYSPPPVATTTLRASGLAADSPYGPREAGPPITRGMP